MAPKASNLDRFTADATDIVMMGTIKSATIIVREESQADIPVAAKKAKIDPALIGKAGEVLVAGELMRRGIEVAYPASDKGIDMLAYRLNKKQVTARHFVPVQVKSRAESGFNFHRIWFDKVPGVTWFTSGIWKYSQNSTFSLRLAKSRRFLTSTHCHRRGLSTDGITSARRSPSITPRCCRTKIVGTE